MFRRRLKIVLLILILPWVLFATILVLERVRGKVSLARYRGALAAKGEKLTAAEFTVKPAVNEDNGIPALWETLEQLRDGATLPNHLPPRMVLLPSGRAVVAFKENAWREDGNTFDWNGVAADLFTNQVAVTRCQELLKKPVLRTTIDYQGGPKMPLLHLAKAKKATYWLGAACGLALQDGWKADGLEALLAQLELPRTLAEDRLVISELVRIAIGAIGRVATWEALQAEGWTDEELARIQAAWQRQDYAAAMARALEGERVYVSVTFDLARKSNDEAYSILFWEEALAAMNLGEDAEPEQASAAGEFKRGVSRFFKKQLYCRLYRFCWIDQDELHYLQYLTRLIKATREGASVRSLAVIESQVGSAREELRARNIYDRLRFPSSQDGFALGRAHVRAMQLETEKSLVIAATALKRYQVRHGGLPSSLEALVPEILPAAPVDYMDGKPLRYKLLPDGKPLLYSIGENGKDDGGSAEPADNRQGAPIATRNLWKRKDFVWPMPATPEELEIYRKGEGRE